MYFTLNIQLLWYIWYKNVWHLMVTNFCNSFALICKMCWNWCWDYNFIIGAMMLFSTGHYVLIFNASVNILIYLDTSGWFQVIIFS